MSRGGVSDKGMDSSTLLVEATGFVSRVEASLRLAGLVVSLKARLNGPIDVSPLLQLEIRSDGLNKVPAVFGMDAGASRLVDASG